MRLLLFVLALSHSTAQADFSLESAFTKGRIAIFAMQGEDGSFTNLVNTSSTLYATQMVLLYEYLGILEEKRPQVEGLLRWTWSQQNSDGGLPGYFGGPSDVGISVQAYLAARIAGEPESTPRMQRLASYFKPRRNYADEFLARPFLMVFGLDDTDRCLPNFVQSAALGLDSRLPWFKALLYPILHILMSGHVRELPPEKIPLALGRTGLCPGTWRSRKVTEGKPEFWDWIESAINSDGTLFDYTPTTIPGLMALSTYAGTDARKAKFDSLIAKGLAKLETNQIRHGDGSLQQSPGDAAVAETAVVLLGIGTASESPSRSLARPGWCSRRA